MVVNYPSMSSVNFGVPDFKTRGRGTLRITESPGHPSKRQKCPILDSQIHFDSLQPSWGVIRTLSQHASYNLGGLWLVEYAFQIVRGNFPQRCYAIPGAPKIYIFLG